MSLSFDGKVVLITGAGKGLGRAYAHYFAERGASVVVNNRVRPDSPSSARAVAAEIAAAGGEALVDEHSVETEAGGQAMVAAAIGHFGKLDVLICNAAISVVNTPFDQLTPQQMREVIDVNLWGTFFPLHAALPHMIAARSGRVVLTTSHIGLYGRPGSSAYGCSKAAIVGLARSVGHDVADRDIRINVIAPGAYTQISSALGPDFAERAAPERVAPVVGWLCSEHCRESGIILSAAGGRVRRARIVEGEFREVDDDTVRLRIPELAALDALVEAADAKSSGQVLLPGPRQP